MLKDCSTSIWKNCFYISYALVTAEELFRHSCFFELGGINILCYLVLGLACTFSLFKISIDLYRHSIPFKTVLISSIGFIFIIIMVLRGQDDAFMVLWVYTVASWDCDFNKLVKISSITILFTTFFIIISAMMGIVPNLDFSRLREETLRNRFGLGFLNANHSPHFLLFGALSWFYIRCRKISWYELITFGLLNYLLFWLTDSRWPFLVGCLLIVLTAFYKNLSIVRDYHGIYTAFGELAPLLSGGFIILQGLLIPVSKNEFWRWLDKKTSNRLKWNYSTTQKYGHSLVGTPIVWSNNKEDGTYNYVDSLYNYSLLSYGWIFVICFFLMTIYITYLAARKKDTFMIIALIIIAVSGIFENYAFRVECNPFFLFLAYAGQKSEEKLHI